MCFYFCPPKAVKLKNIRCLLKPANLVSLIPFAVKLGQEFVEVSINEARSPGLSEHVLGGGRG